MKHSLPQQRILILGIGNTLLSDEGFGPTAIYYLEENYDWPINVRLVDGATLGLMLLAELLESDLVFILDIALGDQKPGTFYSLSPEDLGKSLSLNHSMHQTSLNDVLINCELTGHKLDAKIFALEPFDYQTFSPQITPEALQLLPSFCEKVINELQKIGVRPTKRNR